MINEEKKKRKILSAMAKSYGNRQPSPEIHCCYFPLDIPRKTAE